MAEKTKRQVETIDQGIIQKEITLRSGKENLELHEFINIVGLVHSGGQAKHAIRSGQVMLNSAVETRKRKKLKNGDIIGYEKKKYQVKINVPS
jgi:ribosome-associated protein